MILTAEYFRKERLSIQMAFKPFLCRSLIQLERNHVIRSQISLELSFHYNRIITVRAFCGSLILICYDLTTTGFAMVNPHL